VVNEVFASLQAEVNAIEAQIEALLPIITIPTDLPSVIRWITNFIDPQLAAYANYARQVAELITKISELTTAIENAASRITSCSITVPTITT
jgi:prefoldin subunit 5